MLDYIGNRSQIDLIFLQTGFWTVWTLHSHWWWANQPDIGLLSIRKEFSGGVMVGWSAMLVLNGASCGRRHICVRLSWSNFRFGSFVLVNRGPYNKYLDATVHLRGSLRKDEWESRERKKGKEKASEVYYWVGYHGGQLRFRLTGDPLKNHTEFSLDLSHQRWEIWGLYLSTQLPFLHGWGLPLRVFQSSSYTSRKKFLKHQENLLGREAERFRGLR